MLPDKWLLTNTLSFKNPFTENTNYYMIKIQLTETRNSYFCVSPKNHRLMFVA